jgi:DNA-binding protein Fis
LAGPWSQKRNRNHAEKYRRPFNGRDLKVNGKGVPLRSQAEEALQCYFETLNGHKPAHLYDLVMREVEEPLFKVVMGHVQGNQSRAATILGINRGTLRKKLKEFGITSRMPLLTPVRRALLSVSDKTGIVEFARELKERGIELLSTGGTAKLLVSHGIPVKEVAEHTGFPEIMGGRVKTLHPKIHGGLLGRRGSMKRSCASTTSSPSTCWPSISTLSPPRWRAPTAPTRTPSRISTSAAPPWCARPPRIMPRSPWSWIRAIIAHCSMSWRPIRAHECCHAQKLARQGFAHTAQYDAMVSAYFTGAIGGGAPTFPDDLNLSFRKHLDLRYGENPHQQAAFYTDPRAIGASVTQAGRFRARNCRTTTSPTAIRRSNACGNSIARLRHRQACQSLRRRAGRQHRRGLRARLPHRPHLRLRRHHRLQSRIGCGHGARHRGSAIRRSDLAPSVSDAARRAGAKDNVRVLESAI